MKKRFFLASLCLILGLSVIFAGCGKTKAKSLSNEDAYGIGAVSMVKLLQSEASAAAMMTFTNVSKAAADGETDVTSQFEKFNEYFSALDSFLGEDVVSTKTEANTDSAYPYQTKMTIKGQNFDGEAVEYIMYYTEELKNESNAGGESEKLYVLNGVMVMDETTYYIEGTRADEVERDETETELEIRAYLNLSDKTNYIKMEQEHSVEGNETEKEYVYSIYTNGVLKEQTAVEFEVEHKNNKVETAYELEFKSGTERGKYEVKRVEKNGQTKIEVEYNINGNIGKFEVREVTDSGKKEYKCYSTDGTPAV